MEYYYRAAQSRMENVVYKRSDGYFIVHPSDLEWSKSAYIVAGKQWVSIPDTLIKMLFTAKEPPYESI